MKSEHNPSSVGHCTLESPFTREIDHLRCVGHTTLSEGESRIRREPLKAIAFAAGAGYLICLLPLGAIVRAIASLLIAALLPVAILCGAARVLMTLGCGGVRPADHPKGTAD